MLDVFFHLCQTENLLAVDSYIDNFLFGHLSMLSEIRKVIGGTAGHGLLDVYFVSLLSSWQKMIT